MKKESRRKKQRQADGMPDEYRFDYADAKPNRFASRMSGDVVAVVLEPDVAAVFHSSQAVNELLRSVISAMPGDRERKPVSRKD
jgi:hypothetical protein